MNDSVFVRHRRPTPESCHRCIGWYLTIGNAAVIRLDNTATIRFDINAAAHSERCTGKTQTLYLATWRSAVRLGNVACCLAFGVQSTSTQTLCTRMSWGYHVLSVMAPSATICQSDDTYAFSQPCMSVGICRLLPLYTIIYAHRHL